MRRFWLFTLTLGCCLRVVAAPPSDAETTCDSTKIVSVDNFASGDQTFSPGSIARILWCDFELPSPTTPFTSVVVHGVPAAVISSDFSLTSPTIFVLLRGYPSFRPREIVARLPDFGLLTGPANVQILRDTSIVAATATPIKVDNFAPGIFTFDRQPDGPAVARNAVDDNYIFGDNLAHVGDTITIYCEGLGPTTSSFPGVTLTTPEVRVGNQQAAVVSSRLAPEVSFGIYAVTFVVPPVNFQKRDQPIEVHIGGMKSNTATLPVVP